MKKMKANFCRGCNGSPMGHEGHVCLPSHDPCEVFIMFNDYIL